MKVVIRADLIMDIDDGLIKRGRVISSGGIGTNIFEMIDDGSITFDKGVLSMETIDGEVIVKDKCIKDSIIKRFIKD